MLNYLDTRCGFYYQATGQNLNLVDSWESGRSEVLVPALWINLSVTLGKTLHWSEFHFVHLQNGGKHILKDCKDHYIESYKIFTQAVAKRSFPFIAAVNSNLGKFCCSCLIMILKFKKQKTFLYILMVMYWYLQLERLQVNVKPK